MRKTFKWADNIVYSVKTKDGNILKFKNERCFSKLNSSYGVIFNAVDKITLYNINCVLTMKYRDFYLNYLIEMLGLEDTKIGKNSFTFKSYDHKGKNLLVLSLLRFLFEAIGYNAVTQKDHIRFFNSLQYDICEYTDQLSRFCYFYSKLPDGGYFHVGHSWEPVFTRIKTTQEFLDAKKIHNVNKFFTHE